MECAAQSRSRRLRRVLPLLFGLLIAATALAQPPPNDSSTLVNPSSAPRDLTVLGGRVYFTADDGLHGRELWMCDDQGDCTLAVDFIPGSTGGNPINHGFSEDLLLIVAGNEWGGVDLWQRSDRDGTTTLLYRSTLPADRSKPFLHGTPHAGNGIFLTLRDPSNAWNVWVLAPGETELRRLTDFPVSDRDLPFAGTVMPDGTDLFLVDKYLWRSDGTREGTRKVTLSGWGKWCSYCWNNPLGQRVVLALQDPEHGLEPWITDGTAEGTLLLRDIRPGPETSTPGETGVMRDWMCFGADDGEHGLEPWISDGTPAGTLLLKDINPGRGSSDPHYFAAAGGLLYFGADNGLHGVELWCSDGTSEGTRLVKDINPSLPSSNPFHLVALGSNLHFCATTSSHGDALWSSDGTEAGTRLLTDIIPGPGPGGPDNLVPFNGRLLFTYDEPTHGEELWIADLETKKARLLADINIPRFNPSASPRALTAVGDKVFFVAPDLEHGQELWVSDGSPDSTRCLRDIAPGSADGNPDALTPGQGTLYFTAAAPGQGRELWRSDGTSEGTVPVVDIRPGDRGAEPRHLLWADPLLYFTADDGMYGREVWKSDGTRAGTVMLDDFTAGAGGTAVVCLTRFGGRVYGYFERPGGGLSLYGLDPPAEPFAWVVDLPSGTPTPGLDALIASSASAEALIPWVAPCWADAAAEPLRVDGLTYFVAHTDRYGAELWQTDGTIPGTRLVLDAFPGPAGSSPRHLTWLQGRVYFLGDHPNFGQVLWATDGTALGSEVVRPTMSGAVMSPVPALELAPLGHTLIMATREPVAAPDLSAPVGLACLVLGGGAQSLRPMDALTGGPDGPKPRQLTAAGTRVYFTADDGVHGEELWAIEEEGKPVLVKDILVPGNLLPLHR